VACKLVSTSHLAPSVIIASATSMISGSGVLLIERSTGLCSTCSTLSPSDMCGSHSEGSRLLMLSCQFVIVVGHPVTACRDRSVKDCSQTGWIRMAGAASLSLAIRGSDIRLARERGVEMDLKICWMLVEMALLLAFERTLSAHQAPETGEAPLKTRSPSPSEISLTA